MDAKSSKKFRIDMLDWKIFVPVGLAWGAIILALALLDWPFLLEREQVTMESFKFVNPGLDFSIIVLLVCVTAGGIAAVLHPFMFWTSLALMVGLVILVAMSFYQYQGIRLSWLVPGIGMVGSGVTVFFLKELKRKQMLVRLDASLERMVNKSVLQYFKNEPEKLNVKDRLSSMSLMAIEVVGVKDMLGTFTPEEVFGRIRQLYNEVINSVHGAGGIVFPGYRNGFMAAFGESLVEGHLVTRHAERALQTALKIQKDNAVRIRMSSGRKEPVLTLKIGVASSRAYVTNLGTIENIEFCLAGELVEEVEKLKSTCDLGNILFSRMTRDLLVGIDPNSSPFKKRVMNSNDGTESIQDVFDFDPLFDAPDLRQSVFEVLKASSKYERKDTRWPIKKPEAVVVTTNIGPGELINISKGGIGLKLQASATVGTVIRVKFDSNDNDLKTRLANRELSSFGAEVRWASSSGIDCIHGLVYKNLDEADKDFILQCVLETQEGSRKIG